VLGYVGGFLSGASSSSTGAAVQDQSVAGRPLGDSQSGSQGQGAGASSVRVRTLADQREGEDGRRNLYNGNQVCFFFVGSFEVVTDILTVEFRTKR
jgi:hypothetical protein